MLDIRPVAPEVSDQFARKFVQAFQQMGKSSKETENPSDREMEILSYLAKEYHDQEIADTLFLSIKTVRTHLKNVYRKLHVRPRTEAVLKYLLNWPLLARFPTASDPVFPSSNCTGLFLPKSA